MSPGRISLFAAVILMSAGVSQAQITGEVWENFTADNADVAPSGSPVATFTSSQIYYGSGDDSSLSGFLNYGGTVSTLSGNGSDPMDDDYFRLTGQIYLTSGDNTLQVVGTTTA